MDQTISLYNNRICHLFVSGPCRCRGGH